MSNCISCDESFPRKTMGVCARCCHTRLILDPKWTLAPRRERRKEARRLSKLSQLAAKSQ